jgi:hypothetical protein
MTPKGNKDDVTLKNATRFKIARVSADKEAIAPGEASNKQSGNELMKSDSVAAFVVASLCLISNTSYYQPNNVTMTMDPLG